MSAKSTNGIYLSWILKQFGWKRAGCYSPGLKFLGELEQSKTTPPLRLLNPFRWDPSE